MTAQTMWEQYIAREKICGEYSAWAFGAAPDKLAQLVLDGTKTATASAYPLYALDGEDIPKEGEYSVILDSREEAVCVIKTTKVFVVPYNEVDAQQAWKEGEGDRSLSYWRKVHEDFFREELASHGLTFDGKMPVVCEEFIRLYP